MTEDPAKNLIPTLESGKKLANLSLANGPIILTFYFVSIYGVRIGYFKRENLKHTGFISNIVNA